MTLYYLLIQGQYKMTISITTTLNEAIKYEAKSFSGGERHIQLLNLPASLPKLLKAKAIINSSNDLMDLLLINNALSNHYGETVLLNLEIPYMPYARQDRVCAQGQAFSLELIAQLISTLKINSLVTWDCHSQVGVDLTGAFNVSATEIIKTSAELVSVLMHPESVLVCPDKGALSRCADLQQQLDIRQMVNCEKRRDPATGKITHTDVLVDDLTGKTAVITDDICDGGYTFIKIAEQLKAKNVERVVLYVTHGIFSKGFEVFDGLIDSIFTTNSFPNEQSDQLKIIDYEHNFNSKTQVKSYIGE